MPKRSLDVVQINNVVVLMTVNWQLIGSPLCSSVVSVISIPHLSDFSNRAVLNKGE